MEESINILILSCGTRNKIVEYFKNELSGKGKVYATDSSEYAPALYEADEFYIVPRIDDPEYLETIFRICKENNIKGVLSLIDPELTILAKNYDRFLEIGTQPIVSNIDSIETSFNKYDFYKHLSNNGINTIKSYISIDEFVKELDSNQVDFPVFVKPIQGSASLNINKVQSIEELNHLFAQHDNLIIQEFMDGIEYGADVYIDLLTNESTAIFIKEKIKMRAGETDKSVSFKDEKLFNLIEKFIRLMNYRGIIDIDIFAVDGKYYISEVNPRFGGGYPHAYEAGVNIPKMIVNNLKNIKNEKEIGNYKEKIFMMKYSEVKLLSK